MRSSKPILSFLCCLAITLMLHAQHDEQHLFRHLDQSGGLLNNNVSYISQDARGFIWILTSNGLQRYDGSRFVNYLYNPRNSDGIDYISGNLDFFCDIKQNKLWIADKKIKEVDLNKSTETIFDATDLLKDTLFGFKAFTDYLNNTWYAGPFGVLRKDPSTNKIITYYLATPQTSPHLSRKILFDQWNDQIWVCREDGLLLFDKKSRRVYSSHYNPINHPLLSQLSNLSNGGLFMDSNHNIWLVGYSNPSIFFCYCMGNHSINTYSLTDINKLVNSNTIWQHKENNRAAPLTVYNFFEDSHHILWITTGNAGLLKYNRQTNTFSRVGVSNRQENSISYSYDIFTIFQDRDENIWLGCDKGLSVFNPYRQNFYFIRHEEGNLASLPNSELTACAETQNGDILAGTWGWGITVFDKNFHFKKNIHFGKLNDYDLVWSFIQNNDGKTWVGCQHGYVHIYDPYSEKVRTIHPPETNNSTIFSMANDKSGNIYLGLFNGEIVLWNKQKNKFYNQHNKTRDNEIKPAAISKIYIDDKNRCWVGTAYGLKLFDIHEKTFCNTYLPDKKNKQVYSTNWLQILKVTMTVHYC